MYINDRKIPAYRRALASVCGIGLGTMIVLWFSRFPSLEALLILYVASVYGQVLGVYLEERARARHSRGIPAGLLKLEGSQGIVATPCDPSGTIRIGFEVWTARSRSETAIRTGERVVVVRALPGGTLLVDSI